MKIQDKIKNGVTAYRGAWIPDKNKPDIPENWNTFKVWLNDGSVHYVKDMDLVPKIKWARSN